MPAKVFVDSGAWIALALTHDPLHVRAREAWDVLGVEGTLLRTSVPIVIETFTFLDRNTQRDVALAWKDSLEGIRRLEILDCATTDLAASWDYFRRKDLRKLSAVDATSFVLMKRERINTAFTFDQHFATAGFNVLG